MLVKQSNMKLFTLQFQSKNARPLLKIYLHRDRGAVKKLFPEENFFYKQASEGCCIQLKGKNPMMKHGIKITLVFYEKHSSEGLWSCDAQNLIDPGHSRAYLVEKE